MHSPLTWVGLFLVYLLLLFILSGLFGKKPPAPPLR